MRVGWSSVQAAACSLDTTPHYSRELLMMGIVVPETR